MNTIYRIVWNAATGKWVVASELAKGRKKTSTKSIASMMLLAGMVGGMGLAHRAEAAAITLNTTATASCGTPANNALLNPAWTNGTSVCGTAAGEAAAGVAGGSAFGDNAVTSGFYATALGAYSVASTHATAIGASAMATGQNSLAVGLNSQSYADYSTAIGTNATAGSATTGNVTGSTAIGWAATANSGTTTTGAWSGTAVGTHTTAIGDGATAFGDSAGATADRTAAFGRNAKASATEATAFGANTVANQSDATAIGFNAQVTVQNATAIGANSVANVANTVSVGSVGSERNIVNVAAGINPTDAVNVSQLEPVVAGLGGGASINPTTGAVTGPTYNINGNSYGDVGSALTAANRYFKADGLNSGSDDANASGSNSVAIGPSAGATVAQGIAIGQGAQATTNEGTIAIGAGSSATGENSVALGAGSTATRDNVVSVGYGVAGNGTRQIINVTNGTEGTDAVNVNQLTGAVAGLGGGASISSTTGVVTSPTYNIQGDTQENVGDALDALDSGVNNRVAYDQNDDGSTNYNSVTLGNGQSTGPVALHNVAPGELSAISTDAVNGSQLYATNQQVGQNTSDITNLGNRVTTNEGNITTLQGQMADAVLYDDSTHGSVTLGGTSATSPVGLHNVAAGTANTDAVNVSQLAPVVAGLGGGASINPTTGAVTGPTYNVQGGTQSNVGDALDALDSGVNNRVAYDQNDDGTTDYNSVTLGNGQSTGPVALHNVAPGELSATSTDAVNGSQLYATNQQVAQNTTDISNLQNGVVADMHYFKANGLNDGTDDAQATGSDAIAVGPNATANGTGAVAMGSAANAQFANSVAIGTSATTTYPNAVAIGYQSTAAQESVALGHGASAINSNDTAIGSGTMASLNSTAMGQGATAASSSVAIGQGAMAVSNSTAIGNGAMVSPANTNAVALGAGSMATRNNTVSVGAVGSERQVVNMAAGVQSTDAVNVSQLTPVVAALGGGASIDPTTGAVTGPTYNVQGGTQTDVGTALDALDAGVNNRVAYDQNADGSTNYNSVTMGNGQSTGPVALHNVAAGELSATSTDAVNGSQLYATNQQVAQNTGDITNLGDRVTTNEGDITTLQGQMADAVLYDDSSHGSVTLGGTSATAPVALHNVAAGELSATSTDAVNGSQLYATNQQVNQNTTDISNLQSGIVADTRYFKADGKNDGTDDAQVTAGSNSVAIGANSVADRANTVSVGAAGAERQITNVAAGTEDTDAVNVSQLKSSGLIDGSGNAVAAVTYDQNADGSPNYNSVTMGGGKSDGPVTIKNVAAGTEDTDAVNVGQLKSAGLVDNNGNTLDAVVYDPGSNRGQVTLGGVGAAAPVVLTNVANGVNQYDAVNFGQLSGLQSDLQNQINTVNGQVTNIDNRVTTLESNGGGNGGGTPEYVAANPSTQPAAGANVGDTTGVALGYNTAATGDSASAVGDSAQATGDNSTAVGSNTVASGAGGTALGSSATVNANNGVAVGQGASVASTATNSVALGAGSVATQANSVSVGSAGNERTITNVAAGVNATDAVNVGQLQGAQNWAQSYTDQKVNQLNSRITSVGRHADAGTAGAIAMTNIPQAYQPNQSSVGAGIGAFNGQAAVAVGMSTITPSGRWVLKGSLTGNSQGDVGIGFGASMVW